MASFAALLFDLDGVLADSRHAITRSINHALVEHGLPAQPEEALAGYIGAGLLHVFQHLLSGLDADPALAEGCIAAYRRRYETACRVETLPYPGVGPVVEALARRVPLAVATSKPNAFAEPILEALGLRGAFRAVVGPGLDPRAEPKSATVARALEALGRPASAALVGDRFHDVEAGRANGIATIGVTWGFGSRRELEEAGADRLVDAPEALLGLL